MPARLMRPNVGFSPAVPQKLAGIGIYPPGADPTAATQSPPATAAPEPPVEPPGMRERSHGLRTGGVIVPQAYSCVRVLPSRIAPAWRSRAAAVESTRGNTVSGASVPAVVGISAVR